MKKMSMLDWVAMLLLVIGGLNWGLVGFVKFDLVAKLFGDDMTAMGARVIYSLVGLSAVWTIAKMFMMSGKEKPSMTSSQPMM